jgi:ABC-type uncharacterized transport system permease subunit
MGQIVSGVAVKAGIAVALGQLLYFSQMFITDMVMPLAMLPEWLQAAVVYLPGYSMVQLVRPPLIMGAWSPQVGLYLALSLGYTLLAGLLAAALFRWAPKECYWYFVSFCVGTKSPHKMTRSTKIESLADGWVRPHPTIRPGFVV